MRWHRPSWPTKAAIESAKAQIVASKAAVENSKVMLSYTTIRSLSPAGPESRGQAGQHRHG